MMGDGGTMWHLNAPGIILNSLASARAISKGDKKWSGMKMDEGWMMVG